VIRRGSLAPRSFLGAALLAAALLALWAAPALAVQTHPFTGVTIGPEGKAAAGQFTDLASVTVDSSSGDLYVLDVANSGRLYKFDSIGEPLNFTATGTNFIEGTGGFKGNITVANQVAIAPPGAAGGTAGDIYIANDEEMKVYSPAGSELGRITASELCGVATDAVGNIYVKTGGVGNQTFVTKYTPTANPPTDGDESGRSTLAIEGTCNLAIDSQGRIYLSGVDPTRRKLWKIQGLAAESANLVDPNSRTVAVEPGTEDVYVSNGGEISQYAPDGSLVSQFGEGQLVEVPGLGIAKENGNVYVANRTVQLSPFTLNGRVDVFGPLLTLPKAVAGAAGERTKTTAVLHGTIDADGGPSATCRFEYTTQASFEIERFEGATSAPCAPAGPFTGETPEAVSAATSGLTAGTIYRFRLVGENAGGSLGSDENGSAPGEVPSFETVPAFDVQTGSVGELTETTVRLEGSIDPEGVAVTECFFEYGKTTAYGSAIPCEGGPIGSGNAPVPVHAAVSGLTGSTGYHYRLVGGTAAFGGIKVPGSDVAFGTLGPPQVLSQAFSGVGQTTATISGSINPHSSPTTYFVEYVTDAVFRNEGGYAKALKVPAGGVAIGSGFTDVAVSRPLTGLVPGTRYHARLYAENALGHGEGPDQVFTTHVGAPLFPPCPANEPFRVGWSATLPDCRAYEQASPTDKNGDSVAGLYPQMFAAEDGSAVTFYSPAGTPPPGERGGTQNYSTYLTRRDAATGSWSSQRLLPPEELGEEVEYLGSTPDLRYAIVEAGPSEEAGLYVIDTEGGSVTQIVPKESKPARSRVFGLDGTSTDGSRVFFESKLTIPTTPASPAPVPGHTNLYLWERSTGDVSLVGVLPAGEGGEAPPTGSFGGAYEWYVSENPSTGGTLNKPGNAPEPIAVAGLHAIPPGGGQIFFTSAGKGQLYLRRGLGGPTPATVRISTPNEGVTPAGEAPAAFLEATPDGSRAFFMSGEKLTASASSAGRELYRWDASAAAGQALTDIAPGAEVQGLLGVNSAGTSGYFVGRGVLAAKAEAGGENLYRFAEKSGGGGFRITFIATLAAGGEQSPDRRNVSPLVGYGFPLGKTSRLSENGETLLFASRRSLTGYENFDLEGASCEAGLCPELYLYSAKSGELTCVSCDPTGEAPLGAASLQDQFFNAYFTPTEPPAISFSRNLSVDGTKVFFQTPDPLVAGDTNGDGSCPAFGGTPGHRVGPGRCQDVYEWEAVGSGSCKAAEANGGCLYLLSTGQSDQPSYFIGASMDGSSAFIATSSQLVPADRDQAADIYDVREGGGLASQHVRPPVPCGSGEACKGPGAASPPPILPGTPSFQGPGNPKAKQCKKGYVAKKGKCVKKGKHPQKKGKKNHHKSKRANGKRHSGGSK
jgi:hypothetical protein